MGRLRAHPLLLALLVFAGAVRLEAAADIELLRRPRNSAISMPVGEGLDFVHAAEPLGKGRFRLRALNSSHSIVVPELGDGTSFTGQYGFAYGLTAGVDLGLVVPLLIDSAGGLSKFGTGDPVLSLKLGRPAKLRAKLYNGFQLLLGLPLGFKGERGLDQFGGVRPFSNDALDVGLQLLMDIDFDQAALYLNGGIFRSGNPEVLSQLVYGMGVEIGRRSRWGSFNAEFQSRVAFTEESRAEGVLKIGGRLDIFRGIELELNREFGFVDHPVDAAFSFGLRMHGVLSGRRRLMARSELYKPPPRPRRTYAPAQVLRLAIVDFAGFEDLKAGERLVEKIKTRLAPHDSIEIVDLSSYADIPQEGALTPRQAIDLARKLAVDVVVTGTVSQYKVEHFSGFKLPFVIEVPETRAQVKLRYRVLSFFDAAKTDMKAFTEQIVGKGKLRKRVRLLPSDRRDITVSKSVRETEAVQEAALDDLVGHMLASMAERFSWMPPGFLP